VSACHSIPANSRIFAPKASVANVESTNIRATLNAPALQASKAACVLRSALHGSTFGGTNNPFGLGPKLNFLTPSAAVTSEGVTLKHLIAYGDTTVAKLYSGLPGIANGKIGFSQVPGYCQASVAACQAAGVTVSGFLTSFVGAPGVRLTPGNPGILAFPCP
jgi:hypothetical protein